MSSPFPFTPNGPLIPSDTNKSAAMFTKNVVIDKDLQIGTAGTKLGFFGTTPVVKQTATDLATVITLLQAYGLSA